MNEKIWCRDDELQEIEKFLADEKMDEDLYILSWTERDRFRENYRELKGKKIWFWIRGTIIHGTDELKDHIQKGIHNKQWQFVKNVNDVLREYDLIEQNSELHCYPSEVQIESTNICNARCIMCSHSYDKNHNGGVIGEAFLENMIEILPFLRMVYLHGNGEPFLNPALPKMIKAMAQYEIRFMTNTNLSILTDEILECIQKYFTEINISCDGAVKETFEEIRCNLNFEKFCANCRSLRESCPNLYMTMAAVSMRQNVEELPQMVELAKELGFQKIVFSQLCPDVKIGNQYDALEHYPNVALYYYKEALERGKELGIEVVVPGTVEYQKFAPELFEKEKLQLRSSRSFEKTGDVLERKETVTRKDESKVCGVCDWVIKRPYININQFVNLCCISQMKNMGNLKEQSFAEIWNGERYQSIRKKFQGGELPWECEGCEFLLQNALEHLKTTEQYMSQFEYRKERKE
ncbi:MAG: SPASM domain-containing protein [Schaedlerella sp.]|nr:SPASM domain-containing protein [Schaedlerella sp.]